MKTIIVDAGHGHKDPGVTWNGRLEKDINLQFALTLKWLLVQEGYRVKLTRSDDSYPELRDRVKHRGDLFISLHVNSKGTYPLLYFSPNHNSIKLAEAIDRHFQSGRLWPTSKSRFGSLYFQHAPMPAVLVELGAIDTIENTREERIRIGDLIVAGVNEWFH